MEDANTDSDESLLGAHGLLIMAEGEGGSHLGGALHWSWHPGQKAPSLTARALVKQPRPQVVDVASFL